MRIEVEHQNSPSISFTSQQTKYSRTSQPSENVPLSPVKPKHFAFYHIPHNSSQQRLQQLSLRPPGTIGVFTILSSR